MGTQLVSLHRNRVISLGASEPRLRIGKFGPRPSPEHPLILSASELRDFLRCRVRWAWRYHAQLIPKEKPVPLLFGGIGHEVLEAYYRLTEKERTVRGMRRAARRVLRATRPEQLELKDMELLQAMAEGYADWSHERDADLVMRLLEPEKWFDLPLLEDGSIRVRGKIDLTFKQKALKGTRACFEHKFKAAIKLDVVDMNLQLSVYLWALRALFPKARRFIAHYNVLRKQMPGPRVKADLFARESVERTAEEIDQWVIDTRHAALDMLDAAIYPNPMESCSWDCDYQTPCMLRGRSEDMEVVFNRDYVKKEGR